jgi:hypothetical protein
MNARKTRDLPAPLEGVRRRFEQWREVRKARARIPDSLWASAVKLAREYGINRTAKALRVDYYSLKKRLGQESVAGQDFAMVPFGTPESRAAATFLELASPSPTGACDCTLELEDTIGSKMRVHLKAATPLDLAALCRSFWNPAS